MRALLASAPEGALKVHLRATASAPDGAWARDLLAMMG